MQYFTRLSSCYSFSNNQMQNNSQAKIDIMWIKILRALYRGKNNIICFHKLSYTEFFFNIFINNLYVL